MNARGLILGLITLTLISCYSIGPGSCDTILGSAMTTEPSFNLGFGFSISSSYVGGTSVSFSISSTLTLPFKGFLIYVTDSSSNRVGSFFPLNSFQVYENFTSALSCPHTIGHSLFSSPQLTMNFQYNTPQIGTGALTFHGVIVHNQSRWQSLTPVTLFEEDPCSPNFETLGSGTQGGIYAIQEFQNKIIVGGLFTQIGAISANFIASWNGNSWSSLGTGSANGLDYFVFALAEFKFELYVGGEFLKAGGISASKIAKWDGTNWSVVGDSNTLNGSFVWALKSMGSYLVVGGLFQTFFSRNLAMWNGDVWYDFPQTVDSKVRCLATIGNDLYVGGEFVMAGNVTTNSIARWNGTNWFALGLGFDSSVVALTTNGSDLYAAGQFLKTNDGITRNKIAKWNGTEWSSLGTGIGQPFETVYGVTVVGSEVWVGGIFEQAGGVTALRAAKWNGQRWSPLFGSGVDAPIVTFLVLESAVYVAGYFLTFNGVSANNIVLYQNCTFPPTPTLPTIPQSNTTSPPLPTTTTSHSSSSAEGVVVGSSSELNIGLIVGVIVAVLILIIFLIAIIVVVVLVKRKREREEGRQENGNEMKLESKSTTSQYQNVSQVTNPSPSQYQTVPTESTNNNEKFLKNQYLNPPKNLEQKQDPYANVSLSEQKEQYANAPNQPMVVYANAKL